MHRALADLKADTCEGCGQPISEAWTLDADPNYAYGTHYYEVPDPTCCLSCKAQAIAKGVEGGFQDPVESLHFFTRRIDRKPMTETT